MDPRRRFRATVGVLHGEPGRRRWLYEHRLAVAVLAVTVAGLAARLYRLGDRVLYYDEAWFSYWALTLGVEGPWSYRPTLHGPFLARLDPLAFALFGPSDASARLVVAVVGGLLPLVAWLFRERLSRVEVGALAVVLAVNPILLYYSRFARKDVPLAAFALLALGCAVRALDTGRVRYAYAGAVALGVAAATKESVLLWLLTWVGAGVFLLDRRLLLARTGDAGPLAVLGDGLGRARRGLRTDGLHVLGVGLTFLAVVVYFYAPRAGPGQPVGLWRALGGEFGTLPAVVEAATVEAAGRAVGYWAGGDFQGHPYLPYLADTLGTLRAGAAGVVGFALVGFLYDRYAGDPPRDLVALNFYAGAAAVVGYPLANRVPVPWSTVHAVVPLAVPAAVGVAVVVRWGRSRLPARDPGLARLDRAHLVRAAVAGVVLSAAVVGAVGTAVDTSYRHPYDSPRDGGSELVYYAQSPASLRTVTAAMDRVADDRRTGADVLYVGQRLAMDESAVDRPPETGAWFARMPLPWYTEQTGADVHSVASPEALGAEPPPMVITTRALRPRVAGRLPRSYGVGRYPLDDAGTRTLVVFFGPATRERG
jgi:uncharacterized protein (TIGR03663 family)